MTRLPPRMPRADAVIGAGWGDEGKGVMVDALVARRYAETRARLGRTPDIVVLRANGGAQAGHGVTLPDGRRHVFHHVGAGVFNTSGRAVRTHLAATFVAHPMVFARERAALAAMGVEVRVTIDPEAEITTPWDMALNQAAEISRGQARHGSTGLGFGETIERAERYASFRAADIDAGDRAARLRAIRDTWVPARMAELGIDPAILPESLARVLAGESDVLDTYLSDLDRFGRDVPRAATASLAAADHLVFEGAQGLQLDQEYGVFPHVTRSYTGLRNPVSIARALGLPRLDVTYVTRVYATRHGAGPLPGEAPDGAGRIGFAEIVDLTNAPNPWQGHLRAAPLDTGNLAAAIAHDRAYGEGPGPDVAAGLAVTCLDQIRDAAVLVRHGGVARLDPAVAAQAIATDVGVSLHATAWGPTRATLGWTDARSAA